MYWTDLTKFHFSAIEDGHVIDHSLKTGEINSVYTSIFQCNVLNAATFLVFLKIISMRTLTSSASEDCRCVLASTA